MTIQQFHTFLRKLVNHLSTKPIYCDMSREQILAIVKEMPVHKAYELADSANLLEEK